MELSLETCRLIVRHVRGRADLSILCRVNGTFRQAAEQALYNTICVSNARDSYSMCSLFARTPRLAAMVEALTLSISDGDDNDSGPSSDVFWSVVFEALQHTVRLRFLELHLENSGDVPNVWILGGAAFRLRSFHCDLQWNADLVSFLNAQPDIDDLYIVDYCLPADIASTSTSAPSPLDPGALPNLSTLQCTFAEAACALVPTRPISRLKTCFSKTRSSEKREELSLLFSELKKATRPLHSLDIADSFYSAPFSMELLACVVGLQNQVRDLRYLGMLVLPVGGNDRLKFYGLLRTLRFLECVEIDVSEWDPPPSIPAGMRALASELRLYCSSLRRVIFVIDFERTVVTAANGNYVFADGADTDDFWREV